MDVDMDALDAMAPGARTAGDLPAGGGARDRDADAFEAGQSRRELRREDNRFKRLLRDRANDRAEITVLRRQLAEVTASHAKGRVSDLEAEISAAEEDQRDALADGDAERAAKASRRVAELATDRKVAEMEAAEAERTAKAPAVDPAAEEWVRRNAAWFHSNDPEHQKRRRLALLAHQEAVAVEGFAPNTPDYFRHIEERVEAKFPGTVVRGAEHDDEEDEDDEETQPAPRPATRAGAAPVTQRVSPAGARPGAGGRGRTVQATPEQVEAAKVAGVSIQEYMASALELQRAGRSVRGGR